MLRFELCMCCQRCVSDTPPPLSYLALILGHVCVTAQWQSVVGNNAR